MKKERLFDKLRANGFLGEASGSRNHLAILRNIRHMLVQRSMAAAGRPPPAA